MTEPTHQLIASGHSGWSCSCGESFGSSDSQAAKHEEREKFKKEVLEKIDVRIKNIRKSAGEHGEEELSESLALVNELTSLRAEVVKVE